MKKLLIISILLGVVFLSGTVITRNDVITTAMSFESISNWTPVVDFTTKVSPTWHSYYKTEENGGNPPYNKLSYCWSGYDTPSLFISRVENEENPVPAGGVGTDIYDYCRDRIAGLDCAGFVMRCWGRNNVNHYDNWNELCLYSISVNQSAIDRGDWLNIGGHQILVDNVVLLNKKQFDVYESTSSKNGDNDYPGVQKNDSKTISIYTPYSIFPQFSECTPEQDSTITENDIEIGVTVL